MNAMSMTARHESKKAHFQCQRCRDWKARSQHRDLRRASTLCFECYRSERERQRAEALAGIKPRTLRSPFKSRPALTERQILHRRRMFNHLTGRCSNAAPRFSEETALRSGSAPSRSSASDQRRSG